MHYKSLIKQIKGIHMKQQKQIQEYLVKTLGKQEGIKVAHSQNRILFQFIKTIGKKSRNQRNMLIKTILPRVALYKAFLLEDKYSEQAYELTRKYMIDTVGAQKHKSILRMELIPGFYAIYSRVFINIMKKTDLQQSTTVLGHNYYNINVTNCLWHNACVENDCPELCRAFCEVDDITYGGLRKIGFSRTQTLGMGGTCCDFHFYKKNLRRN